MSTRELSERAIVRSDTVAGFSEGESVDYRRTQNFKKARKAACEACNVADGIPALIATLSARLADRLAALRNDVPSDDVSPVKSNGKGPSVTA